MSDVWADEAAVEPNGTHQHLEIRVPPGQWRVILRPENRSFHLAGVKHAAGGEVVLVCTDALGELARVETEARIRPGEVRDRFPDAPVEDARFVLGFCPGEGATIVCRTARLG